MKSLKKALLLAASLVTISAMTLSASATETNSSKGDKSIAGATVTLKTSSVKYDKKDHAADIVVDSVKLGSTALAASNYDVSKPAKAVNTGSYTVTVTGKNGYTGTATATFEITASATGKKAKKTTITGTTKKTVKASKKKAKKVKIKIGTGKNHGKVTWTVKGGKAKTRNAIKVTFKNGKLKVVLPPKAQKGTYKIKVKVAAYNYYKEAKKTFKIVVK